MGGPEPRVARLEAQGVPAGWSAGSGSLAGRGWAGVPRTPVHRGGRGHVCGVRPSQCCVPEATRRRDRRPRADSQRDRKVDPDRPGAARQDPDSQTAPNSDRQKCRQAGPDSWAHGARSGRHSAGHTDEAAAPGTPAFLGTLPGSSDLSWPPGGLRPAGPPALPRVQADRGLIQGAGCAEVAASRGCWPGPRPVVQMHCTPSTEVRQGEAGGCR